MGTGSSNRHYRYPLPAWQFRVFLMLLHPLGAKVVADMRTIQSAKWIYFAKYSKYPTANTDTDFTDLVQGAGHYSRLVISLLLLQ